MRTRHHLKTSEARDSFPKTCNLLPNTYLSSVVRKAGVLSSNIAMSSLRYEVGHPWFPLRYGYFKNRGFGA